MKFLSVILAFIACFALIQGTLTEATAQLKKEKLDSETNELLQELDSLKSALLNKKEDGTVVLERRMLVAEAEARIPKLQKKLAKLQQRFAEEGTVLENEALQKELTELRNHELQKATTKLSHKAAKAAFENEYNTQLINSNSPCANIRAAKATAFDMKSKAQFKIDESKCKLERAQAFSKWVEEEEKKEHAQAQAQTQTKAQQTETVGEKLQNIAADKLHQAGEKLHQTADKLHKEI